MKRRGRLRTGDRSSAMAITGSRSVWLSPWSIATSVIVVTVAILALASPTNDPDIPSEESGGNGPGRVLHDVGIPLEDVGTQADWYTYESGDVSVRFFTVADGTGNVHAGLDACDVCYSANLGFHQNGTKVQCNSCGKSFGIDGIGTKNTPGTCWPSIVPYEISEGYMLIDTEFLDGRAYMFR